MNLNMEKQPMKCKYEKFQGQSLSFTGETKSTIENGK